MVIGFLEDTDFAGGQGDEVLKEALDGDGTALQRTLENDGSMGTKT